MNNTVRPIFFLAIIFFTNISLSSIFIDERDIEVSRLILDLKKCDEKYNSFASYPVPISRIYSILLNSLESKGNCSEIENELLNYLNFLYIENNQSIEYSSKLDNFYLKSSHESRINDANISYTIRNYNDFFSYKMKASVTEDDTYLDGSYISFYTNFNTIVSFEKRNKWWSPSDNISLILSNQAPALTNVSLSNNMPFKIPFLSFLGNADLDIFVGKLDDDRHVKNAKIMGMRLGFQPKNNVSWSLFRTAQFGGEGRSESLETLINLLIGRDNRGQSGINIENEPGNQLAGGDFRFFINKGKYPYEIFGQLLGEDEAGYLPSRYIYLFGGNLYLDNFKLTAEFADTMSWSGNKNYTYNHFIYKSGYRYENMPLGASIDADSETMIFSLERSLSNNSNLRVTSYFGEINMNSNDKNVWSDEDFDFIFIKTAFIKSFKQNIELEFNLNFSERKYDFLNDERFSFGFTIRKYLNF